MQHHYFKVITRAQLSLFKQNRFWLGDWKDIDNGFISLCRKPYQIDTLLITNYSKNDWLVLSLDEHLPVNFIPKEDGIHHRIHRPLCYGDIRNIYTESAWKNKE